MSKHRRFWLFILAMALLGVFVAGWILRGGPLPAIAWAFDGLAGFFAIVVGGLGG